MKTSSKTGKKVKKTIPWSLHMAIVRLQGTEELEYEEACARAAMLIEEGGEKYKETVKAEANRMYKSRFLGEQNKAKNTWIQKGYDDGFGDGKKAGIDIGRELDQIKYPCSKCGGDLILRPGNKDTESAIEFLKSQGWGHSKCIETSKPSG
ncbi:hypothetical protein HQ586_01715 [Candidatus Bathyarchaeota archaeon]|nr:hypothetical protein [Candidatus Bathyarchaeota archaeon]